jgi:hypothetical protein
MKKSTILIISSILIAFTAKAQNLLINGDFEDGESLTPWWVFVDAGAAAASVDSSSGSVNYTEISNAGNNTYDIQLIQELSADQIDELSNNISANYYLTFDAIVPESRNCNLFFGEIGGAWTNLAGGKVFTFVPEQITYSATIHITQVFDAMKFGLEIGTSNVPVEFDNFMLSLTPPAGLVPDRTNSPNYLVYPNPATDILHINVGSGVNVSLYSLTGLIIESKTAIDNTVEFDVSKIAPGIYLINMLSYNTEFVEKIYIR